MFGAYLGWKDAVSYDIKVTEFEWGGGGWIIRAGFYGIKWVYTYPISIKTPLFPPSSG